MKKGIFIVTFLLASVAAFSQWAIDKGNKVVHSVVDCESKNILYIVLKTHS